MSKPVDEALREKLSEAKSAADMVSKILGDALAMLTAKTALAPFEVEAVSEAESLRDEVHDAAKSLLTKSDGKETLKQLLQQHNARKLSEVPDSELQEFLDQVKQSNNIPF